MRGLYNFFIFFYGGLISIASVFNSKAKLWRRGRVNVFQSLEAFKNSNSNPLIWFHCASLGEFEQGRPVIESIKKSHPNYAILITFFSPSGYEIRKEYPLADYICYLPLDTPSNAKKFLSIVNPEIAIFVKYEYWFNYMKFLRLRKTPLYVISAIFRPNQHFFKSWGGWFANQLHQVEHFYVQNQTSCNLLESINISNYTLTGDTRFDRVFEIARNRHNFPLIDQFCTSKEHTWVVGSSWLPDELLIAALLKNDDSLKIIIAPHEIHATHLKQLEQMFAPFGVVFYTQTSELEVSKARVLVVDTMGMLSQIYQYGHVAYIGGGFGNGIHNILEAAVYNIPVVFGPKYQKFDEAVALINIGGAFSVNSESDLLKLSNRFAQDVDFYDNAAAVCSEFVRQNLGATQKIITSLWKN